MRKRQAWLEQGNQRVNSCKPMKDATVAKKLRQAYARKAERRLTKDEFGTVRLVDATEAQLSKVGIKL